jgi:predicted amidohydrolase
MSGVSNGVHLDVLRLGVLPWRVRPQPGVAAWAARLEAEVAVAAAAGAAMLLMPEYAPLEVATQPQPQLEAELREACAAAPAAVAAATAIARRHNVWLLPGTLPFVVDGRIHNRAPFIAPDGRVAFQDKRTMTRFETEQWHVDPGASPKVFDTLWGRIGIAICYDLEFPPLVRAQVEAGAWLILAPTCTDTLAGFNRVRIAAQARAMENQCFVAVAPTTGSVPEIAALDDNRGRGCVFGPVDRGFADDGLVAEGAMDDATWLFVDLDPARLAAVRSLGAVLNHADYPAVPPACTTAVFA